MCSLVLHERVYTTVLFSIEAVVGCGASVRQMSRPQNVQIQNVAIHIARLQCRVCSSKYFIFALARRQNNLEKGNIDYITSSSGILSMRPRRKK